MGTERLPQINGRRVVQALRKLGWQVHRIHGSHHVLVHPDKPAATIVVAVHVRPMKKGALADILEKAGLTVRQFRELL